MAASYCKVYLIGNVTRDPEIRYTPKGTPVCDIGLAINRIISGGDEDERKQETVFVDVTLWSRLAEIAQQYLEKGRSVFVEGRLHLDTWQDQSGQKRSKLKVVGEHLQLLGQRSESADRPPPAKPAVGAPRPQAREPELESEPNDIPF